MTARARLATNIRSILISEGLNQVEAAKELGVSKSWLSELVNENNGSFDKLDLIASKFGLDVAFLLFPPDIVMRDLSRQGGRDTTPQHKGGTHVGSVSEQPSDLSPTEDDVLDALDRLVVLLQRFRLTRQRPHSPEPEEPGDGA